MSGEGMGLGRVIGWAGGALVSVAGEGVFLGGSSICFLLCT